MSPKHPQHDEVVNQVYDTPIIEEWMETGQELNVARWYIHELQDLVGEVLDESLLDDVAKVREALDYIDRELNKAYSPTGIKTVKTKRADRYHRKAVI